MNGAVEDLDVQRFRTLLERRFGLVFDDSRFRFLAEVLHRRANAMCIAVPVYLDCIQGPLAPHGEVGELARELTVGETYFFRHMDQFRAFSEVALPDRLCARSDSRHVRILSAGCASGDEAYSLAILVRACALDPSWIVSVHGADVNPTMLEKATLARYSSWSLRETPVEIQRRWFVAEGREFALDASIRSAVTFEKRNLTLDDSSFWQEGRFDVVFCRNVIMYLAPAAARLLVARIAKALAPGGYLFLGHAENLRELSQDFVLSQSHDTFYYRRKEESAGTCVERRPPDAQPPIPESTPHFEPEARDLPTGLLPTEDPTLLGAVRLIQTGELERARAACNELIALDQNGAGGHYLLALCDEGIGERQRAGDHDRIAAYLDPAFAMPHLHLGLMARRSGEREVAQRELALAVFLLGIEDASRLTLFGGGFNREGLVALCSAELGRLDHAP